MSRIPIRLRLTAWFVLVLAAMLVALGSFVVNRLRSDLTAEVDRSLTVTAGKIAQGYRDEGAIEFTEATTEAVKAPGSRTLGAQLVDMRGVVVQSAGNDLIRSSVLDPRTVASAQTASTFTDSYRLGTRRVHVRAISVPVAIGNGRGVLVVADPLEEIDSAVNRVALLLLIGGAVGLVLAGFGAWAVAGRAMRPVERMTMRASAIDIQGLEQRVWVPPARDELNRLAQTFNAMLDRLQSGVAAREQLIANASHELRAPLAAMRAELDVSLRHDDLTHDARAVLHSLQEEAARMGRIVDNLLTLARIDDGQLDLLRSPVDLHELAERAVRTHAAAAAATEVTLDVSGESVTVSCDRDRIEQVIGNLLDNAIRVSPPGGSVRVHIARDSSSVRMSVIDGGPGVPPELTQTIFERFTRADPVRGRTGGAGLGLAISREIVVAHGGQLSVTAGEGGGSTFIIAFPTPPPTGDPPNDNTRLAGAGIPVG